MMPSFAHAGCLSLGKGGKSGFAGSRPFHFLFFGGFSESRRRKARQGLFMVSGRTGAELLPDGGRMMKRAAIRRFFAAIVARKRGFTPAFVEIYFVEVNF